MTILYCILAFCAGFLFGVFATSLVVMAGDKRMRDYDILVAEYEEMKKINAKLIEKVKKLENLI